jgi:acyl dehydratase
MTESSESSEPQPDSDLPFLLRGRSWQEQPVGFAFRTTSRTITESDLVTFVNWAGIHEPLFLDERYARAAGYAGRLVPGMLTYCFAEGLVVQTGAIHNTGMAFLGATLNQLGPVFVGDTLDCVVRVTESRASRTPGRGVVTTEVTVRNQHGEAVLRYTPVRYIRGDDDPEMASMRAGSADAEQFAPPSSGGTDD